MSEQVVVAFLASLPPTLLALATLVIGIRNTRKVEEVHKATNSLTDRLVASTKLEAHALGVREEKARGEAFARGARGDRDAPPSERDVESDAAFEALEVNKAKEAREQKEARDEHQ